MRFLQKIVILPLLLIVVSCTVADYNIPPVEIRTDKTEYSQGEMITITIQNISRETLILTKPCSPNVSYLHEWDGRKWKKHFPDPMFCNWPPPVTIEPGESIERMRMAMQGPGLYRIPFQLHIQAEKSVEIEEEFRLSNPFSVK